LLDFTSLQQHIPLHNLILNTNSINPVARNFYMKSIQLPELDLDALRYNTLNQSYLVDLSPIKLIRVTGEDAFSFLQAQFSNDLGMLENEHCQLHAYCNPKGRILAVIRIVRNQEGYWIIVPEDIADGLVKRLKMYVLRAKVQIQQETEYVPFGSVGPPVKLDCAVFRFRLDSVTPRMIIIIESGDIVGFSEQDSMAICHFDLWRWMDIQSGIPQVYATTTETFIPQTVNLELVDAINFRKGCFPGQEIVARLKYLGKPKQRLIIASIETSTEIKAGDEIYTLDKPGQKSGLVVDAVQTGASRFEISAMVPAGMVESGELRLGSADGQVLQRIEMPYEIP
jgi:folate-binding protein YgfZ